MAKEKASKSVPGETDLHPYLLYEVTAGGTDGSVPVVLADPLCRRTCWSCCPLAAVQSGHPQDKLLTPDSSSKNWTSPTFMLPGSPKQR